MTPRRAQIHLPPKARNPRRSNSADRTFNTTAAASDEAAAVGLVRRRHCCSPKGVIRGWWSGRLLFCSGSAGFQRFFHPTPVIGVAGIAVVYVPALDEEWNIVESPGGVFEEESALAGRHEFEKGAWLGKVVVRSVEECIPLTHSVYGDGRFIVEGLFTPFAEAIGFVGRSGAFIVIKAHTPILMETVERATWTIDGQHIVVDPEAIALGITIGKESAL